MADLLCHGTGRLFPHREGADLFENREAAMAHAFRFEGVQTNLASLGFKQVEDSNAWEKDGVRITVQQVLQEGIDNVLQKHAEAVRFLHSATAGS